MEDGWLLPRNPCRIRGAQAENAAERPVLTVAQPFELAEQAGRRPIGNIRKIPSGYRLRFCRYGEMLLVTFASLRSGEATALRRADLDLNNRIVKVRAAYVERSTGELPPTRMSGPSSARMAKTRPKPPRANGTLMARKITNGSGRTREPQQKTSSDLRLSIRAGDGNRTRTISLGICTVRPCHTA